jgi:N-acetylneuraminic acid mutarotase
MRSIQNIFKTLAVALVCLTVVFSCSDEVLTDPELRTLEATNITAESATLKGELVSEGGVTIQKLGICFSPQPMPTIVDGYVEGSLGNSTFTVQANGLSSNTHYNYRVFAQTDRGVYYGDEKMFLTVIGAPVVQSFNEITDITTNSAVFGGKLLYDGGTTATAGVCWATTSNPTVDDFNISGELNEWEDYEFTCNLSNLQPNTVYFTRAYATNSIGTSYSQELEFRTLPDPWTQLADFGGEERSAAVSFAIGNRIYVGTGTTPSNEFTSDFWEYNPDSDQWSKIADFPGEPRHTAVAFVINGKGYVGTGVTPVGESKDFWAYDPTVGQWARIADFGGSPRDGAAAFVIGDKGYVGTGISNMYNPDFWEYDSQADVWTQKQSYGGGVRYKAVGFALNGKGYIGAGYDNMARGNFWEYNPSTDNWTEVAGLDQGRFSAICFVIGEKAYVGSGYTGSTPFYDLWEFSPADNTWTKKTDMKPGSRYSAIGVSLNGKGYFGTGAEFNQPVTYKKDFWVYDPNEDI